MNRPPSAGTKLGKSSADRTVDDHHDAVPINHPIRVRPKPPVLPHVLNPNCGQRDTIPSGRSVTPTAPSHTVQSSDAAPSAAQTHKTTPQYRAAIGAGMPAKSKRRSSGVPDPRAYRAKRQAPANMTSKAKIGVHSSPWGNPPATLHSIISAMPMRKPEPIPPTPNPPWSPAWRPAPRLRPWPSHGTIQEVTHQSESPHGEEPQNASHAPLTASREVHPSLHPP